MKLDGHTRALIAVAASITTNCRPCLQSTLALALESGADEQEVTEAIEIAKHVRNGAASKMDVFALGLIPTVFSGTPAASGGCGCEDSDSRMEGKNG